MPRYAPLWCLVLLLGFSGPAMALRCEGRVVGEGDHAYQVQRRCGEPFWVEDYTEWLTVGERGPLERRIERRVEAWYYNFGPERLMRRLLFRDNRLVREDTVGYGFRRLGERCDPNDLPLGLSTGEVVARCGQPAARDVRYADTTQRDERGFALQRVLRREEWIYEFDGNRRPRLLYFIDGRLDRLETLDR